MAASGLIHFSERRTAAQVYKLEKYRMELVQIMHKVYDSDTRKDPALPALLTLRQV
jgi:hypothetical protein